MNIVFLTPRSTIISKTALLRNGLGGNETTIVLWAECLAKLGHHVTVYSSDRVREDAWNLKFRHLSEYTPGNNCDVLIACRQAELLAGLRAARTQILYLGDRTIDETSHITPAVCDLIWYVSKAQFEYLHTKFDKSVRYHIGTCGVDDDLFNRVFPRRLNSFAHTSVPYRGLKRALALWPMIRERLPSATLDVTSDYTLWGYSQSQSDALREVDLSACGLGQDTNLAGVTFHGALPREEYLSVLSSCQFLLYITEYPEMCCISALEASALGLVPILSPVAALRERVVNGVSGIHISAGLPDEQIAMQIHEVIREVGRTERMSREARIYAFQNSISNTIGQFIYEVSVIRGN